MTELRDICELCNVSVFDALDLYYTFGFEKFPEPEKAMKALHKCYKGAQLPYLKMEATGDSESVLVSSAQELLKSKDGPKSYYIAYSLSQFVGIEELGEEKPTKEKLSLVAAIAHSFLRAGETFQTLLLMPAATLEEITQDITCQDFIKYYSLIVEKKGINTAKFLEDAASRDTSGVGDIIAEKMSKSVLYERKQEKIETAKTVGVIAGKSIWKILVRKIQLYVAPYAGFATAIVAGIAAANALILIIGLFNAWAFTWFFAAIGLVGALYIIWGYWISALSHPVVWCWCLILGAPSTILALIMFIINIVKLIGGML